MTAQVSVALVLFATTPTWGQVISYEANLLPNQDGFNVLQIYCDPTLELSEGWFIQDVDLCPGDDPPGGQEATYGRSLAAFIGAPTFFVQWRAESTADAEELPWGGGATLSCWSNGGVNYIANFAKDEVEIWRDNLLPILHLPIEAGTPHTYRLELRGTESYAWLIDGQMVDSGIPEGVFPIFNPNIGLRGKAAFSASVNRWAYIRYGVIPQPNSGDFDSSGTVDHSDLYFFVDCLLGPDYDAAGPGCTWADMNTDGVANAADVSAFVAAMLQS